MNYALHLLIYLSMYIIVDLSLNLVVGYCGLVVLSHAAYFAVGSYAFAIVSLKLGWGFAPASAFAVVVAVILSLAVSIPALRFKGDFFVLVSLTVQAMLFSLMNNWTSMDAKFGTLANLTNGPFGISEIPRPRIFGLAFDSLGWMAAFAVILAGICAIVMWLFVSSPWGRLLKSIRDDELAARNLGKNSRLAKVQAFAIACGMAALGGVLYASYVGYIDPSSASLDRSIQMLSVVLVGGAGNFRGPIIGAVIMIAVPELLRLAHFPDAIAANVRLVGFGLLLILLMHVRPQGLAGKYRVD